MIGHGGEKKLERLQDDALVVHLEDLSPSNTENILQTVMTVSKARGVAIISTLAGINFLNTMGSGILIAALPHIAKEVNIPDGLILWPAAVYALAAGCLLHVFGAIGDIVGPKTLWVVGSFLFVVFTVALGLAATSMQIILFLVHPSTKEWKRQLREDVDWIGALILSVSLGMLLYVLGMVTSDHRNVQHASNIALLSVSLALLVAFPCWMHWQAAHDRPALIPNRLWRKATFTSACLCVSLCWASLNGIEYFTTLFFQQVQGLSALDSSIRYFSQIIMGTSVNIALVYMISRVRAVVLAVVSACITLISPALMATVNVEATYWARPCWALFLSPVNPWEQSLAGGVFNQVAQFGNSFGLAITAVIAASVTEHSTRLEEKSQLMDGFRAAFWTIFACTGAIIIISVVGFRNAGTVGQRDPTQESRAAKTSEECLA
ncbi:putative efflux pump protein [Eutypa lata UCREL1]|uniref:Putative efflux pump protein n=1 Tax=Eutypa lata (strain UCR-EL1) TaxID=1287681 RepID=M7SRP7_EUTLA|nr:putative efflux pump protein [Eutypa lata UCREL1]